MAQKAVFFDALWRYMAEDPHQWNSGQASPQIIDYLTDSDPGRPGHHNRYLIPRGMIPYREEAEWITLILIGRSGADTASPRLRARDGTGGHPTQQTFVAQSFGAGATIVQIQPQPQGTFFKPLRFARIESSAGVEDVMVETITAGVEETWKIHRGLHGTQALAHEAGARVTLLEYRSANQRVGYICFQADGRFSVLPIPEDLQLLSEGARSLRVEVNWTPADEDEARQLSYFKFYYDNDPGALAADYEAPLVIPAAKAQVPGQPNRYSWPFQPPRVAGQPLITAAAWYARVSAVNRAGDLESALSDEAVGVLGLEGVPTDDGPPDPVPEPIDVLDRFRLKCVAKLEGSKKQADIASANLKLYFRPFNDPGGIPTPVPGSITDTLAAEKDDQAEPFDLTALVTAHGLGWYYYLAFFVDGAGQTSQTAVSPILVLDETANTTDTGAVDLDTLVEEFRSKRISASMHAILVGITSHPAGTSVNTESARRVEMQVAPTGTSWTEADGFTGPGIQTAGGGFPFVSQEVATWSNSISSQAAYRVLNAYGWTGWRDPRTIVYDPSGPGASPEDSVHTLAGVAAWVQGDTQAPIPPKGNEYIVEMRMGETDKASLFEGWLFGHRDNVAFPAETVLYTPIAAPEVQADLIQVRIPGENFTGNPYVGNYLKFGVGNNALQYPLLYRRIAAAAGEMITLDERIDRTELHGTLPIAEVRIVDKPLWEKVDYPIIFTIRPNKTVRRFVQAVAPGTKLKWMGLARNEFGNGPRRWAIGNDPDGQTSEPANGNGIAVPLADGDSELAPESVGGGRIKPKSIPGNTKITDGSIETPQLIAGIVEALMVRGERVRVEGAGGTIDIDNSVGLRTFDDSGLWHVQLGVAGGLQPDILLAVRASSPGVITFDGEVDIFANPGDFVISPHADDSTGFIVGNSFQRFSFCEFWGENEVRFRFKLGFDSHDVRLKDGAVQVQEAPVPATLTSFASVFLDEADGNFKVKFPGGSVKTLATP